MTAAQIYLSFLCALGEQVIPSLLSQWMTEVPCPMYRLPFSQYGSARIHGMSGTGLWGQHEKCMHTDAQNITLIPTHQGYEVCPRGQTNLCQAKKKTGQSRGLSVLAPAQWWLQALVVTHLSSPVFSLYERGDTQWLLPSQFSVSQLLCFVPLGSGIAEQGKPHTVTVSGDVWGRQRSLSQYICYFQFN